jgi:hypothetical protein
MSIPKHSEWKTMKTKYGVATGGVSGINVGKALDNYWNSGAKTPKEQYASLEALEKVLAAYISKLDKKKVKQYAPFQKAFLDDYVGEAHKLKEDAKRYYADIDTYKKELAKFFTATQQLEKGKTTKNDLEKYKSGPVRGLTALGKSVRKVDISDIDGWLGTINDAVQKLPATPSRQELDDFVDVTIKTAEKISSLAKAKPQLA